jgi:thioredoxin-like negative regulator of GroEL
MAAGADPVVDVGQSDFEERILKESFGCPVVVERRRDYRDGAAKVAMVRIFSIFGKRSDLADDFRTRLASALY